MRDRPVDYTTVTELPLSRASSDQCAILYGRYHLALEYCEDKDVLEVGCGSGIGLGYLARRARRVVGGDIDERNCQIARSTYQNHPKIKIGLMDAQRLPLEDQTFDVVILFEALYYLPDANAFLREAFRVLRTGGLLILSTVNCDWSGFNPSPFSTPYFSARELSHAMTSRGFDTRLLLAFPESATGMRHFLVTTLRRVAVHLRLVPKTMKNKEWLKRLFFGQLKPLPHELPDGFAPLAPLTEVSDLSGTNLYRILYAIGQRP